SSNSFLMRLTSGPWPLFWGPWPPSAPHQQDISARRCHRLEVFLDKPDNRPAAHVRIVGPHGDDALVVNHAHPRISFNFANDLHLGRIINPGYPIAAS